LGKNCLDYYNTTTSRY